MIYKRIKKYPSKIFCVGRNKTGTTSLKKMFEMYGFKVANQSIAERLDKAYFKRDFQKISKYCEDAEVFQDFPFSYPETFRYMDIAFPNAKFILTIRDNPEQWYDSIKYFYTKLFAKNSELTSKDLEEATYVRKGWMYQNVVEAFCTPDEDPLNKEILINSYNSYNENIVQYFKKRNRKLLVINLSDSSSYVDFCNFLNIPKNFESFPWENKTSEIWTPLGL